MRNKFQPRRIVCLFRAGKHSMLSTEKVMIDGRVVTKSVMVTDDVASRGAGLTPLDFCLENLLENNVDLKSVSLSEFGFVSHDLCIDYLNHNITNFIEHEKKSEN